MAARPRKRQRGGGVSAVRPIDKELKVVGKAGIAATQVETVLKTATFPGTIVGLRWSLSGVQDAGTAPALLQWAIVVVQDGNAASTMAVSDGADMYTPEQDVLAFGSLISKVGIEGHNFEGSTKTMRKMKQGDQLIVIMIGEATQTWEFRGVIQFFFKT